METLLYVLACLWLLGQIAPAIAVILFIVMLAVWR